MPKVVKKRQKRSSIILFSTLAAIVVAGVIYFVFARKPTPRQAITQNAPGWEQPAQLPEKPPGEAQPPGTTAETPPPTEPSSAPEAEAPAPTAEDPCRETSTRISEFFSYLDQRNYVAFYKFKGGSERHFAELLKKLFANPPVIARETDSLYTILRNTAHFYRVLGRDNLFLIKDILESEREIIEPTMADFYHLSVAAGQCGDEKRSIKLPLQDLYPYAGFFLNTLGGQSYLFRRAPRVRTLTKYYSVLVIDRANDEGLNKYGIDIRPAINSLIEDVESMRNLASQEQYLRVLQNLKIKYEARYGG